MEHDPTHQKEKLEIESLLEQAKQEHIKNGTYGQVIGQLILPFEVEK
jgi:hypothetical protein